MKIFLPPVPELVESGEEILGEREEEALENTINYFDGYTALESGMIYLIRRNWYL